MGCFLKNKFQYQKEKVEFGFGKSHRDAMLEEIHTLNKKLENLLERSDKIVKFQRAKTDLASPRAVKSLLQYWHHADRIYALINHSWGCPCKYKHCAHLWLQHRTSSRFEFKLLVLWAPHPLAGQTLQPWDRQGLHITSQTGTLKPPRVPRAKESSKAVVTTTEVVKVASKKRRVGFAGVR